MTATVTVLNDWIAERTRLQFGWPRPEENDRDKRDEPKKGEHSEETE